MNFAAAMVCLQTLGLDAPMAISSEDVIDALTAVGVATNSSNVIGIKSSYEDHVDQFDWTHYYLETSTSEEIFEEYMKLTTGSSGFATKSQMIEFARCVSERILPQSVAQRPSGQHPVSDLTSGYDSLVERPRTRKEFSLQAVISGQTPPSVSMTLKQERHHFRKRLASL
eukprot:Protomagalhaensia_sp_Gyna_25__550@NODE_1259_length_2013_cov_52_318642_g737_i3_p3_GENE_NODE_1259_length_2013_cov_52_318642_g737_i3NODE_1259_length_2013_cov_52_318642_g737_i3_p3_ORF_typecomplete_len170_score19_28_NODE_1259_length_2013_cov_52_318642_g737_i3137646